jgi:hypothetical protein
MVRQKEAMVDAGTIFLPAGAAAAPSWGRGLENAGTMMISAAAQKCTQTSPELNLANDRRSKSNQGSHR